MGIAKRVAKAHASVSAKYFKPGQYLVWVERCKEVVNGSGDDVFVAECHVLETDSEQRKAGDSCDWVQNFRFKSAPGNVKALMLALGLDEDGAEDPDTLEEILGEANAAHGIVLEADCSSIVTKENKKDIDIVFFSAVSEEDQKRGVALHEELFETA